MLTAGILYNLGMGGGSGGGFGTGDGYVDYKLSNSVKKRGGGRPSGGGCGPYLTIFIVIVVLYLFKYVW